jgi:Zn-finger nucleic acid-binding protein
LFASGFQFCISVIGVEIDACTRCGGTLAILASIKETVRESA